MAKDDKKKVAPEAREIPIEGKDTEQKEGAAKGNPTPEAKDCVEPSAKDAPQSAESSEPSETSKPAKPEEQSEETKEAANSDSNSDADDIAAEADEVVEEAERVAKAEQEVAAYRDKYLRLQAEWDNYRKRTAEEAKDMRVRAAEGLLSDVLPVLDDFERAINHAENNGETGLLDGVKAISVKLNEVFTKHGLEAIDPQGQAFDALEQQAVSTVEDTSVPDETVTQVYQKGYRLGKKILRPAMVTISTGGPKRESDEATEDGDEK